MWQTNGGGSHRPGAAVTGSEIVAGALAGVVLGAGSILFLIYRAFARSRDSW